MFKVRQKDTWAESLLLTFTRFHIFYKVSVAEFE